MSQRVTYGHFYDDKLKSGITVASLINEALGEKVKITVLEATDRLHGRLQTVDLDGIKVTVFLTSNTLTSSIYAGRKPDK